PAHRRPQRLPGPLAGRARAGPGPAAQPGVRGTRRKPIPAVLAGAGRHGLRGGLAAALPAGGGGGMKRLDAEIAVVGAGPAGQAMALALAASGYGVALVDIAAGPAAPATRPDLRVFALSLASIRLLGSIGAWPVPQAERVQAYRHMCVWQDDLASALRFDAGEMGWPALGYIIEHGVLQHALARRLSAQDGLQCHWGQRVQSLTHHADEVELGLEDGSGLRVRLVVAADGAASPLRQLAGLA